MEKEEQKDIKVVKDVQKTKERKNTFINRQSLIFSSIAKNIF